MKETDNPGETESQLRELKAFGWGAGPLPYSHIPIVSLTKLTSFCYLLDFCRYLYFSIYFLQ